MKVVGIAMSMVVGAILTPVEGFSHTVKNNVRDNFGVNKRFVTLNKDHMTTELRRELESNHDLDQFGHVDGELHLRLSHSALEVLQSSGAEFVDKTEDFLLETERMLQDTSNVCGEEDCGTRSAEEFYSQYQNIDSIYARFDAFAEDHPFDSEMDTLGSTYEERDQKLLWIGDQSKPLVFYFCGIHAREWLTPMFCTYMAETLLTSDDPEVKSLLDVFSFAIAPVANPDGYSYTHTNDNFWRKTRRPTNNNRCIGTDPNRNYATGWGGEGSSSRECQDTFRGYSPFDQDITFNIKTFTDKHQDRLIHINDVHAYGGYWMCPYAGTLELPAAKDWEKMDTCNKRVRDTIFELSGLTFKIGTVADTIYEAAGGAVDYFYEVNGVVHSYTYEARPSGTAGLNGFQPNPSNIMPSNLEMFAGLVTALECVEELELSPIVTNEVPEDDGASNASPTLFVAVAGMALLAIGSVLLVAGVFKVFDQRKLTAQTKSATEVEATL